MQQNSKLGYAEFVILMASMTGLVALSIDAILPALKPIGESMYIERTNDLQLIISLLFLGFAVGSLLFGPLSDSIGRKKAIYIGLSIYMIGCVLSLTSNTLEVMLAGRILQGFGLAGPRIVSIAMIRDLYSGRKMAKVVSSVMTIFILVPTIAPMFGQMVLFFAPWQAIFVSFLTMASVVFIWLKLRQPETLGDANRIPFSLQRIGKAVKEIVSNKQAIGYTICTGLVFSPFIAYLSSIQDVMQNQYKLGDSFAFYFGALAICLGAANFANSKLVEKYGMYFLSYRATWILCALSAAFWVFVYLKGEPSFLHLMIYFAVALFFLGILFGNLNALAMEPLGHITGIGASIVGAFSTFISVPMGTLIGQLYSGSVSTLVGGFTLFSLLSAILMWIINNREKHSAS